MEKHQQPIDISIDCLKTETRLVVDSQQNDVYWGMRYQLNGEIYVVRKVHKLHHEKFLQEFALLYPEKFCINFKLLSTNKKCQQQSENISIISPKTLLQ